MGGNGWKVQVGANPIIWSNDDFLDLGEDISLERCLSEMHDAGYAGSELGHKFPRAPEALRPLLERFDLQLVSGWHSTHLLERTFQEEEKRFATHLDLPQVTYVRKVEEITEEHVVAERLLESGYEVIDCPVPCVLTVVKEINEPRLPSLKGKMAARKAEVPVWTAEDIGAEAGKVGLEGSPTKVVKIFTPPPRGGGEMLDGEPDEVVKQLVDKLKDAVLNAAS